MSPALLPPPDDDNLLDAIGLFTAAEQGGTDRVVRILQRSPAMVHAASHHESEPRNAWLKKRNTNRVNITHTGHDMSWPQQSGDFTLPCPSGHLEIKTFVPSSVSRLSWTSSLPQWPQVIVPTLMPHFSQLYNAILPSSSFLNSDADLPPRK